MKILPREKYSIFNVGGQEPKTSLQTAQIIRKALNSRSKITLSKRKNAYIDYDTFMDSNKAQQAFGYKPKGLEQNITSMIKEVEGDAERI